MAETSDYETTHRLISARLPTRASQTTSREHDALARARSRSAPMNPRRAQQRRRQQRRRPRPPQLQQPNVLLRPSRLRQQRRQPRPHGRPSRSEVMQPHPTSHRPSHRPRRRNGPPLCRARMRHAMLPLDRSFQDEILMRIRPQVSTAHHVSIRRYAVGHLFSNGPIFPIMS